MLTQCVPNRFQSIYNIPYRIPLSAHWYRTKYTPVSITYKPLFFQCHYCRFHLRRRCQLYLSLILQVGACLPACLFACVRRCGACFIHLCVYAYVCMLMFFHRFYSFIRLQFNLLSLFLMELLNVSSSTFRRYAGYAVYFIIHAGKTFMCASNQCAPHFTRPLCLPVCLTASRLHFVRFVSARARFATSLSFIPLSFLTI